MNLEAWNDALTSLQLLQIDPHGFGGVWLRAPFGPVRDHWLKCLQDSGLKAIKLPGHVELERLLGGIDLSLTLQTGTLQMQAGLLQQADQGVVYLSMAERFPAALVAPMTQAMDQHRLPDSSSSHFGVVALDESSDDDPLLNPSLQERLGLWLNLQDLPPSDVPELILNGLMARQSDQCDDDLNIRIQPNRLKLLRDCLKKGTWTDAQVLAICATAQGFGIDSLRVPTLALRVACCHAALNQREYLADEDLEFAAKRVLAPRATQWPAPPPQENEATEPPNSPPEASAPTEQDPSQDPSDGAATSPPESKNQKKSENTSENLEELMVAAAMASLPPHILDGLMTQPGRQPGGQSGHSGQTRMGTQRGRPLPPKPGRPGGQARLHVLATLRAAAPKQKLRNRSAALPGQSQSKVVIRSEDFHAQRFQQRSASCLILALDASGSAALQRLAEAKGAVELLLQQSYSRRDSVCIVAFRGASAQLLLPMTRSLVRAKRTMTGLPGGGGTPLALALKMACEQAHRLHRQGVTPMLVMLSDGRANVTLQGLGGRAQAHSDALTWGTQWRLSGHRALWIDTSLQPDPQVQQFAQHLGGRYLPMPHLQAQRMAMAMDNLRHPPP
jgi:magnesium chelatase subunit D